MKRKQRFTKKTSNRTRHYFFGLILLCFISMFGSAGEVPEVIYFNGRIITLDKSDKIVEAVAVINGKSLAVGKDIHIKKLAGPNTKLVDLQKRTVTTGFIDAHTNPVETMYLSTDFVNCRYPGVPSVKQAIRLANIAQKNGVICMLHCSGDKAMAIGLTIYENLCS